MICVPDTLNFVSTKRIMDTNTQPSVASRPPRGPYRRHTLEFKRQVVLQTLQPGASVARVARLHQLNANQLFGWRKAFREGLLGDEDQPALLPVTVIDTQPSQAVMASTPNPAAHTSVIVLERGDARLRIEGRPDADTLRLVLAQWSR